MTKMNPLPKLRNYRQLQLQIIEKYRNKTNRETSPFPTFPEFIQYVIDSTVDNKNREQWTMNVRREKAYGSRRRGKVVDRGRERLCGRGKLVEKEGRVEMESDGRKIKGKEGNEQVLS